MATTKPIDYRALHSELDELLMRLQSGELSIEEAIKDFERGQAIIDELQKYLKTAEIKVKKLT